MDSQEILLSISTNKKPNIFFINSCFIKNLLALNYSLNEKQQTTGDLNEEIKELICLMGCGETITIEKLKDNFIKI